MTENRVAKLEATAVEDPRIRAAREAIMPRTKTRTIVLHDDEPASAHRGPGRLIVLRILSTSGQRGHSEPAHERVLRAAVPTRRASPATDPGPHKSPRSAKPEAMTVPELEAELARLQAEILVEERRTR